MHFYVYYTDTWGHVCCTLPYVDIEGANDRARELRKFGFTHVTVSAEAVGR